MISFEIRHINNEEAAKLIDDLFGPGASNLFPPEAFAQGWNGGVDQFAEDNVEQEDCPCGGACATAFEAGIAPDAALPDFEIPATLTFTKVCNGYIVDICDDAGERSYVEGSPSDLHRYVEAWTLSHD